MNLGSVSWRSIAHDRDDERGRLGRVSEAVFHFDARQGGGPSLLMDLKPLDDGFNRFVLVLE
jgi:hypothetical protein